MKLAFEITRDDYLNLNINHFKRNRVVWLVILAVAILIVVTGAANFKKRHGSGYSIVGPVVIYVAILSAVVYRGLRSIRNLPKDDGSMLGPKEFDVTEDGIDYADSRSSGRYTWAAIRSMNEGKSGFYLYLDTNLALIFPKRAFANATEETAFRDLVRRKIAAT